MLDSHCRSWLLGLNALSPISGRGEPTGPAELAMSDRHDPFVRIFSRDWLNSVQLIHSSLMASDVARIKGSATIAPSAVIAISYSISQSW
jgi:hypothetical protein